MKAWLYIKKFLKVRFAVTFLIVGLIFAVVSVIALKQQPTTRTEKATATIENISGGYNDENYNVIIHYTDNNGVTHRVVIHEFDTTMKVGKEIDIIYNPNDPENDVGTPGLDFLILLFGLSGVAMAGYGIYKGVVAIKTPALEGNRFNRVDMSKVSQFQIEEIQDNDEEEKEYYFHWTQKFLQGWILETPERKPVFEAVSKRFPFIIDYKFNFVNYLTKKEEIKICTHTVQESVGSTHMQHTYDSYFKINKVDCWEALGKLGYSLEPHIEKYTFSYDVFKYGVKVGNFEHAGTNVLTGLDNGIGRLPTNGIFKVHCKESDIEGFFLACFVISMNSN